MTTNVLINKMNRSGGLITTSELTGRKEYDTLRKAVDSGHITRIRKGIYANDLAFANNIIDVERIIPSGVLCLYSAFMFHSLSTQVQNAVCVAIDAKRKIRLPEFPPISLYYWKKENLQFGIIEKNCHAFKVRITDLERTVCDAIKYRNKIGLDVCGEVLNDYLKRNDRNISKLHEYARLLRVDKILNLYLATRL